MENFFGNAIGEAYKLGKQEQERRKNSPVLVKWPDIQKQLAERKHVYVIDPRLGFNNRTHRLWYDIRTQAMFDETFRPVVAEVEEIVPTGELDPDCIHTAGSYVDRVVQTQSEKRIEQRTVREG